MTRMKIALHAGRGRIMPKHGIAVNFYRDPHRSGYLCVSRNNEIHYQPTIFIDPVFVVIFCSNDSPRPRSLRKADTSSTRKSITRWKPNLSKNTTAEIPTFLWDLGRRVMPVNCLEFVEYAEAQEGLEFGGVEFCREAQTVVY